MSRGLSIKCAISGFASLTNTVKNLHTTPIGSLHASVSEPASFSVSTERAFVVSAPPYSIVEAIICLHRPALLSFYLRLRTFVSESHVSACVCDPQTVLVYRSSCVAWFQDSYRYTCLMLCDRDTFSLPRVFNYRVRKLALKLPELKAYSLVSVAPQACWRCSLRNLLFSCLV